MKSSCQNFLKRLADYEHGVRDGMDGNQLRMHLSCTSIDYRWGYQSGHTVAWVMAGAELPKKPETVH